MGLSGCRGRRRPAEEYHYKIGQAVTPASESNPELAMHPDYLAVSDQLDAKYRALMAMEPIVAEEVPRDTPEGGIYLFSENGVHLYAGRTKRRLGVRIRSHFGTAVDCPFAWLLARERTGFRATYTKKGSRKELLARPEFLAIYNECKQRIRRMQVRFVAEPEPLRQALLEIYTAIASGAKHNDFETH